MSIITNFIKFAFINTFVIISFSAYANADSIQKPTIDRLVIFGDSLSDTGRMVLNSGKIIPSRKTYWQGRFSDGFNWVDYLAEYYDTTSNDKSFIINESIGGATAYSYSEDASADILKNVLNIGNTIKDLPIALMSNFSQQIETFKSTENQSFTDNDLVVIWIGANDLLWVAESYDPSLNSYDVAEHAAKKISDTVEDLIKNDHVKNILLAGLPDFDLTPRFINNPQKSKQIKYFNYLLEREVEKLKTFSPHIYFVHTDKIFKDLVIPNSEKFGYENITEANTHDSMYNLAPLETLDNTKFPIFTKRGDTHVFWDEVHPTSKSHAIIAALLKEDFLDVYFNLIPKKLAPKCVNVEVRNSGAYLLEVTSKVRPELCQTLSTPVAIVNGQSEVFSLPQNSEIKLHADFGKSEHMTIKTDSQNLLTPNNDTGIFTLKPSLQKIVCSGTTLINFKCDFT